MTADFWRRVVKIAFVDRRATIAELENAVGVATVRRNARMASVEKTATLARTIQGHPARI